MKSEDLISGIEPGTLWHTLGCYTTPPRLHVFDLIHATVAEWFNNQASTTESWLRLPNQKSADFIICWPICFLVE